MKQKRYGKLIGFVLLSAVSIISTVSVAANAQSSEAESSALHIPGYEQMMKSKDVALSKALPRALAYYKHNSSEFTNHTYMAVIDYTKPSSKPRLYIVNLKTGEVESHIAAHGKGSDPENSGWAKHFSNALGSDASSVGFFRTAEVYHGKHGNSLRLDGLSSTNSNARSRMVVIHAAKYVSEKQQHAGRSWGCPALDPKTHPQVMAKLKSGALVYAWAGQGA
jgi:hypothetical protein